MARKRRTLPNDFDDIVASGDLAAFAAALERCEIDAVERGYYQQTAMYASDLTVEMLTWLIDHGANIEHRDRYDRTPLFQHAGRARGTDLVVALLEAGADVHATDTYGDTALHHAASSQASARRVTALLAAGADPLAPGKNGNTPLERAFRRARPLDARDLVDTAEVLLGAGQPITDVLRNELTRVGKEYEFAKPTAGRTDDPESAQIGRDIAAGLDRLYERIGVEPVGPHQRHDGRSPIVVAGDGWREQHKNLWNLLVPGSGAAGTVQGEVIRITGRFTDELQRNGGANWDAEYSRMAAALPRYLALGNPLPEAQLSRARERAGSLSGRNANDYDAQDDLCMLVVDWVRGNPTPLPLGEVGYRR